MKDQETQARFIIMRSQGQTFAHIAEQLNVARGTLVNWSRRFRFDIQNLRAVELEELQDKLLSSREARARALSEELQKVEQELKKRDLADVPTARLYSLAETLRRQILRETGEIQFTTPVKNIPSEEYCEQVQDWAP